MNPYYCKDEMEVLQIAEVHRVKYIKDKCKTALSTPPSKERPAFLK